MIKNGGGGRDTPRNVVMIHWEAQYKKILEKFGYSRIQDEESALLLNEIINYKTPVVTHLKSLIHKKDVMVIGAGPSLTRSLTILKKYKNITKIAADSAVQFLVENKIYPQIVVTDLDGDSRSLLKAARNGIMVVHAHGDNIQQIQMAERFAKCVGTTQSTPYKKILNFGGFTDGDRAVFLANHFKAKNVILIGMDFGSRVGRYSKTSRADRRVKLQKLKEAQDLVVWLAKTGGVVPVYSVYSRVNGIKRISYDELKALIT